MFIVIKRFLIVFIVGLLLMSSQIVSAADVDWNSAQHFRNKAELANYLEEGAFNGQKVFNFVITYVTVNN